MSSCAKPAIVGSPAVSLGSGATNSDAAAIVSLLNALWCAWMAADAKSYAKLCSTDVVRATSWTSTVQYGPAGVQSALPAEWDFLERDYSIASNPLAGRVDVYNVQLTVGQSVSHAHYGLVLTTGKTWPYKIMAAAYQAFTKNSSGKWLLSVQSDGWWSGWDPTTSSPATSGVGTWHHDFIHPVQNLDRAVAWYRPLVGEPEVVVPGSYAAFHMGGPRLVLSTDGLHGYSKLRKNLPNGYSIIYTSSLLPEVASIMSKDTSGAAKVLAQYNTGLQDDLEDGGPDPYTIMQDPAGNVFVEKERRYSADLSSGVPKLVMNKAKLVSPSVPGTKTLDAVTALLRAWLKMDEVGLSFMLDCSTGCSWYDDTRLKNRTHAWGTTAAVLDSIRQSWTQYDRSGDGLVATMTVNNLRALPLGTSMVSVTFERVLASNGSVDVHPDHWFVQPARHTHIFKLGTDGSLKLVYSWVVEDTSTPGSKGKFARNLDYTAYPTPRLATLEPFYTNALHMGKPYTDSGWRGWWSQVSVFGAFVADPSTDGVPKAGQTNGYVSLWVSTANSVYKYLQSIKATFLLIPAINSKVGLDNQGSYTTVLVADSEGNALVFTSYK